MSEEQIRDALQVFREAWSNGSPPDVSAFCSRYENCGAELRERLENFIFMVGGFPDTRRDTGGTSDSGSYPASIRVGQRLGDFELLNEIGRGGMATVYEAMQVSLKRKVALKVLPPHLSFSEEAVRKFQREAEAGGRQAHPNIAATIAIGKEGHTHFIAQELVASGFTLADRLDRIRSESEIPRGHIREGATLIADVAAALAHAHSTGVIHRDVKPSNILLTPEGVPKLTDFGLAKVEDALALSRTGDFAGTPFYMSPERISGRKTEIDHRADIYSLGVTLYEFLTLARPFNGRSTHDVLKNILSKEPMDPRKINPRIPKDLAIICLKAMEKEPAGRYALMSEFKADLDRYLAGEAVLARPVGIATKAGKWLRRNPAKSGLIIISFIAFMALILYIMQSLSLQKEQDKNAAAKRLAAANDMIDWNPGAALSTGIYAAEVLSGPETDSVLLRAARACHELEVYTTGPAFFVAVHPKSNDLLVACLDFTLEIRDRSTGFLKKRFGQEDGHTQRIGSIAYNHDGSLIVTASDDYTALIWDATEYRVLFRLVGHKGKVCSAAFSLDGSRVVTASEDMTVRVWSTDTGKCERILHGHGWIVRQAAFSSDGMKVVTVCEDGWIRIWDAESGELIAGFETDGHSVPLAAAFKPDTDEVIMGFSNGKVLLWDTTENEKQSTTRLIREQRSGVIAMSADPEGERMITVLEDNTLAVHDLAESNKHEPYVILKKHENTITSASFHPTDPDRIVTSSMDGTVRVWDVSQIPAYNDWRALAFSLDGKKVVQLYRGDSGRRLRVLDLKRNQILRTVTKEGLGNFRNAVFSQDGSRIFVSVASPNRVWSFAAEGEGPILKSSVNDRDISSVSPGPDPSCCIFSTYSGKSVICRFHGKKLRNALESDSGDAPEDTSENGPEEASDADEIILLKKTNEWIDFAELCPDSKRPRAITLSYDGTARLWNVSDGSSSEPMRSYQAVKSTVFSPDGSRFLLLEESGEGAIYDSESGETVLLLDGANSISLAKFDTHGESVLIVFGNGDAKRIESGTGKILGKLTGFKRPIEYARFSPDNRQILTVHEDGSLIVWDAITGEDLRRFHSNLRIYFATFDELCKEIRIGSVSGAMERWPLDPRAFARKRCPRHFPYDTMNPLSDIQVDSTLAENRGPSKNWKNRTVERAEEILFYPGKSSEEYIYIADQILRLVDMYPSKAEYLLLKALALYRINRYEEALKVAIIYEGTIRRKGREGSPNSKIVKAMCLFKMARESTEIDTSNESIDEAKGLMIEAEGDRSAVQDEYSSLLKEARELEEGGFGIKSPVKAKIKETTKVGLVEIISSIHMSVMDFKRMKQGIYRCVADLDSASGSLDTHFVPVRALDPCSISCLRALPEKGKKLAFIYRASNEDRIRQICTLESPSNRIECLYRSEYINDFGMACHPNGRWIYFTNDKTNDPDCMSGIYFIDTRLGPDQAPRLLMQRLNHTFRFPYVSPQDAEGNYHLCFFHYPFQSNVFALELNVAHLTPTGDACYHLHRLTVDRLADREACFSSDCTHLFCVNHGGAQFGRLFSIGIDGSQKRTILDTRAVNCDRNIYIAVSRENYLACILKKADKDYQILMLNGNGESLCTIPCNGFMPSSICFLQ